MNVRKVKHHNDCVYSSPDLHQSQERPLGKVGWPTHPSSSYGGASVSITASGQSLKEKHGDIHAKPNAGSGALPKRNRVLQANLL